MQSGVARQAVGNGDLLRGSMPVAYAPLTGRPPCHIAKPAAEFDETLPRCEPGAQQQLALPAVVNLTDHAQRVVVASPGASQDVFVANQ